MFNNQIVNGWFIRLGHEILWMEEILHHLGSLKHYKYCYQLVQDFATIH